MENILFSNEAICSMVFDCISQDNNLETGGILIGPKQHNRIVTDIIPSTIYAERKSTTYFQS